MLENGYEKHLPTASRMPVGLKDHRLTAWLTVVEAALRAADRRSENQEDEDCAFEE